MILVYCFCSFMLGFLIAGLWRDAVNEKRFATYRAKAGERAGQALETSLALVSKSLDAEASLEREKKKTEALFQERACYKLSSEKYAKADTILRSKIDRILDILTENEE